MMNTEIKKKWVEALRSGEYKQGKGALSENNKFCCLGVLTDLYVKEYNSSHKKQIKWEEVMYENGYSDDGNRIPDTPTGKFAFKEHEDYPPSVVRKWAGIKDEDPVVTTNQKNGNQCTLSELNDGSAMVKRRSFTQIAGLIEAQL